MAQKDNKRPDSPVNITNGDRSNLPIVNTDNPANLSEGATRPILDALHASKPELGFLEAGKDMLLAASNEFTGQLGVEAIKLARARNATAVDQDDILRADRRLRGDLSAQRRSWLVALGGFTGGASVAGIFTLSLTPVPIPHVQYWWIAIVILLIATAVLFLTSYPRGRA